MSCPLSGKSRAQKRVHEATRTNVGSMKQSHLVLLSVTLVLSVVISRFALGQTSFGPDKMKIVLYGAAYYPEYMPYERLEKDVQLMEQAGITVARMGESSWGLWEPQDGHFEFAWMDRVIDRMHKAGIQVILGTPTYSVPRLDVQGTSRNLHHALQRANDYVRTPPEHRLNESGISPVL